MSEACRYEAEVLHAAEEDRWTDALRTHLGGCDDCIAAASVAPWMSRFERISDREHMLPDPAIIWLKAKLLQGTVDTDRATRPLDLVQMLAYLVVAAGWAALLTWRWSTVELWVRSLTPSGVQDVIGAGALSMSFFALVFVLASMTVMLGLHAILAEE